MVKDTPKESGSIVIPVYRSDDNTTLRMVIPDSAPGLRKWAIEALKQWNLAYTPEPYKGKHYLFSVCIDKEDDEYKVNVASLLEDIGIFFGHYEKEVLCIGRNILNDIDEYDETELYDECAKFDGLVNFHYPNVTLELEEMELE